MAWCAVTCALVLVLAGAPVAVEASSGGEVTTKVVNGKPSAPDGHPWLVALLKAQTADNRAAQFCGGALVAPRWVATAAHCAGAVGNDPARLDVIVGPTDLSTTSRPRIRARRIVVHPGYQSSTLMNDIALVEMSQAVTSPAIDLVPPSDADLWAPGTPSTLRGWGLTESGKPATLYEITVPRLSDAECHAQLDESGASVDFDESTMMCAGETSGTDRMDACSGDSGSPLVVDDPARQVGVVAIGLVSWGPGCGNAPSAYTRLEVYATWASDEIAKPPPNPPSFSDIANSVHAGNIRRLAAAGITTGYADGTFRPVNPVERGQMAAFIDRAIQFLPPEANAFASEPSGGATGSTPGGKVYYGDPAPAGGYPSMVAIAPRNAGAMESFCGGSLVTSTYVLTAAHCVEGVGPGDIELYVGASDLNDPGPRFLADRIVSHHLWAIDRFADDIALIHLTAAPSSSVGPVIRAGQEQFWEPGDVLQLLGWGRTESGGFPSRLQEADVVRLSDEQCEANEAETTIAFDPATHLCADGTGPPQGASACEGDSGGPLLADTGGAHAQVGIVSFGPVPNCNAAPTRYTRVAAYTGWIDEVSAGYFSDTFDSTHREPIHVIVDQQIATGYPDHTFRPTSPVTRGQMATFLAKALALAPAGPGPFTDIAGNVHEDSINRLVAAGITTGFGDGTYRPAEPVKREQMATFLVAAGLA